MDISSGIKASLAGRYAAALYELADADAVVPSVEADLATLGEALAQSADFAALTTNPELSRDATGRAVAGIAQVLALTPLTTKFLGLLAQSRRLAALPAIIAAFGAIAAAARGEVHAEVTSAHPLDEGQIAALTAQLVDREGKAIKLTTRVNPEILGGLVVRIGSQLIDSSLATRLNSLALAMKG